MKEHRDKRYVIIDTTKTDEDFVKLMEQVDILRDIVANYTIECTSILRVKQLIHGNYHAFLKYPISDWETLRDFISIGVSDIYIDGALGFQLKKVKDICGKIFIRVSPTISLNASLIGIKPNSFFIRPEDLHLYDKYIDIIDFQVKDQEKENTLFTIYKRGTFFYDLSHLLDKCNFSVENPFIKPEFGQARINCGQRCLIPGYACHLCDTQIQLTNLVYQYFKAKDDLSSPEAQLQ